MSQLLFPNFADIPQFTKSAPYSTSQPLDFLEDALRRYVRLGLNMDPDFQRAHVWTEQQQIAFVEYILRGGRSGLDVYFNHPGWMTTYKGEFVLVDGKQRLEALRCFLSNKIKVFGYYRNEFKDEMGLMNHSIRFNVNDLKTRKEVLTWYLEMNSGGTPHTNEELEKVRLMLWNETN